MATFRRILIGISGASGMAYAMALVRNLRAIPGLELHGIISDGARQVFRHETGADMADLEGSFHRLHDVADIAAPPASGSWEHHGMVVCPCSMASLAAIAGGAGTNLLHRAADVTLKERRPLVLVPRETPLNEIHLKNMLRAHRAGAMIMPPCPGFYHRPETIDALVAGFVGRMLEQLGLDHDLYARWG
ncbi:MAG: UbiX family flavin prenyltransferase [Desulfovibrionales bacterium]|nr:UbiX family flavin prenyltransferase [Desulfovibrionales bacterium]